MEQGVSVLLNIFNFNQIFFHCNFFWSISLIHEKHFVDSYFKLNLR